MPCYYFSLYIVLNKLKLYAKKLVVKTNSASWKLNGMSYIKNLKDIFKFDFAIIFRHD